MKKIFLMTAICTLFFALSAPAQTQKVDSVLFVSGSSVSTSLNIYGYQIGAIRIPDALAGTAITFLDTQDGINYSNIITSDGSEVSLTVPASGTIPNRKIIITPVDALGISNLVKIRTGTYASPTTQSGSIWIYVGLIKLLGY